AGRLLPGGWPTKPRSQDEDSEQKSLIEQILDLAPVTQLDEARIKELRVELEKVKPALMEARKLAGLANGRYPAVAAEQVLSGPTPFEDPRRIANLLLADAAVL